MNRVLRSQTGFTLLEVMIAFAIMSFILSAVFITQSSSLSSSGRSRNILIANNLARNLVAQKELLYEGRAFDKIDEKQSGAFPDPHGDYKWKIEIKEIDFGPLTNLLAQGAAAEGQAEQAAGTEQMLKMFEEYLKKSVRRMTLTVEYPDGGKTSSLTYTELLVNYDQDFGTGGAGI
jgi:prepilin-type N-terminal cleavage/methylation domain-containing protein